jgi:hypothetical protein
MAEESYIPYQIKALPLQTEEDDPHRWFHITAWDGADRISIPIRSSPLLP